MKKLCIKCKKNLPLEYFRIHKQKGRVPKVFSYCKECDSARVAANTRLIKEQAIAYKGGCCQSCGYDKCIAALEFHHRDPNFKENGIAKMRIQNFDVLKIELDKCDLLCSNCHKEEHERLNRQKRR